MLAPVCRAGASKKYKGARAAELTPLPPVTVAGRPRPAQPSRGLPKGSRERAYKAPGQR